MVETTRFGLVPFRSPLLWESRLISFPLGTEMFHFPRSAPIKVLELLPVGCPIQTSADQRIFSSSPRLFAAYHVFLRLQRQGIHPLLLLSCFSKKTSRLSSVQLSMIARLTPGSHVPSHPETCSQMSQYVMVETDRFELTTPCVQSRCSPS